MDTFDYGIHIFIIFVPVIIKRYNMSFNFNNIETNSFNIAQDIEEAYKKNACELILKLNNIFNKCAKTENGRYVFYDKFTPNLIHIKDLNNNLYYSYSDFREQFIKEIMPYISSTYSLPFDTKFDIQSVFANEIPLNAYRHVSQNDIFYHIENDKIIFHFDVLLSYLDFLFKKSHYTTKCRIQNKIKFKYYIGNIYNLKNLSDIKPFLIALNNKIYNDYIIPKGKIVWDRFGTFLWYNIRKYLQDDNIIEYHNLISELGILHPANIL